MASASGHEEYKQLRKKVTELKRSGEEVSPEDMYNLAALMARWAVTDRLPICLLCRKLDRKPKTLGHVFPHSVLKEAGREKFFDSVRGAEGGISNLGYYAFCEECEKIFQQGEKYFNREFFSPLFKNVDGIIRKTVAQSNDSFPWLYYCLISIIWRSLCFTPKAGNFIEGLEYIRSYLLNWKTFKIDERVKLFLFAPNHEIDRRLLEGKKIYRYFFYDFFYSTILDNPSDPNFLPVWLFCGPLHTIMCYSEQNFSFMKDDKRFVEWEEVSLLTSKTKTFAMGDKKSRIFPVDFYDQIIDEGVSILARTTRLPSAGKNANSESPSFEPPFLHLLPKDISYDRDKNSFDFSTDMFVKKNDVQIGNVTITKVARKGNNEKIVFVAFLNGLTNGGEVALGLSVKADCTVEYMKGVSNPEIPNWDLTVPPFKEQIKLLLVHLKL